MNWREELGIDELKRERPPRGAIVVVLVGVLACLVAVFATTGKSSGEYAYLEFVESAKVPDSKAVPVPGGSQTMQLVDGKIRSTGTNVSGYNLFQIASTLEIGKEAPVAGSKAICTIHAPNAEIGQSKGGLRALYPRSSESGIFQQRMETVLVDFSSHGAEYAALEVDGLPESFTNERGINVEWPEYEEGTEHVVFLIAPNPTHDLKLSFNTIWRSTKLPKAEVSCTLTTEAGKATVETKGSLAKLPPPIDEEAEEEAHEQVEEEQAAEAGESDEAGGEAE